MPDTPAQEKQIAAAPSISVFQVLTNATGAELSAETTYSPAIQEAFKAWNERRAYIDNAANYRVKTEGSPSGKIAPWNKEAKRLFPTGAKLHRAAKEFIAQTADGSTVFTPALETKTCPQCSTPKSIAEFGRAAHGPDGRNLYCKTCIVVRSTLTRANERSRKHARAEAAARRAREETKRHALAQRQQRREQKKHVPKLSRAEKLERKTARTVYDAIRSGARTRREIRAKTGFTFERIGDGIASLLTAPAKPLIRMQRDGDTAMFFPLTQRAEAHAA